MNHHQSSTENPKSEAVSRRNFLEWLGGAGLLALAWQTGRGILQFLQPPLTTPQPPPVPAGTPADFEPDSLTFVPEAAVWLGRDAAGLYALSAVCTHLGCTVRQDGAAFACPCHGSRFTLHGDVAHGPATAALPHVALRLEAGQVVVDVTQTVSPESRLEV